MGVKLMDSFSDGESSAKGGNTANRKPLTATPENIADFIRSTMKWRDIADVLNDDPQSARSLVESWVSDPVSDEFVEGVYFLLTENDADSYY